MCVMFSAQREAEHEKEIIDARVPHTVERVSIYDGLVF